MEGGKLLRGLAVTVVATAVALALLLYGLGQIDLRNETEQAASLRATVLRAAVTCYAVEGRYPPDAQYLSDYYGLVYNRQRFIVTLDGFAENLLPDIAVLMKGADQRE